MQQLNEKQIIEWNRRWYNANVRGKCDHDRFCVHRAPYYKAARFLGEFLAAAFILGSAFWFPWVYYIATGHCLNFGR